MDGTLAGSQSISDNGGSPSASGEGASGNGSVSPGTAGLGISLAALGLVIATQVKIGLAVGVTVANVLAYTDLVGSIGQEQASAIGGGFCSSYIGVLTWGAGIEAQLGGGALGIAAGKKWELKSWNFWLHRTRVQENLGVCSLANAARPSPPAPWSPTPRAADQPSYSR